jgi:hypothetical protein
MKKSTLVPALLLALALPALGVAQAAPVPTAATTSERAAPRTPTLVAVNASHSNGLDRVVFRFRGPLPQVRTGYVDRLIADGSGRPVRVAGRAILQVRFEPARAHTESGAATNAPRRRAFNLPNVVTAVRSGDFEGVTTYGIGLARRASYTVTTLRNPSRVVVSIKADFPTTRQRVWFLDRDNFVDGAEPYFVPRFRRVLTASPATGVMDRLYAGPTTRELAQGLRLVRSGTIGFDDLTITGGTARVRLLGKCTSRGSTVTIAGSIIPTLKQFPSVDRVKVYDRAGTTVDPTGPGDSTPECLEP